MSKNFNKIKSYYDNKLWNIEQLKNVVGKPTGITSEEYYKIIDSNSDSDSDEE